MNNRGLTFVHVLIVLLVILIALLTIYKPEPNELVPTLADLKQPSFSEELPQEVPTVAELKKKYQGVKVLGVDDLSAEEIEALQQIQGESTKEIQKKLALTGKTKTSYGLFMNNLADSDLSAMESYPGPKMVVFYADWCPHCKKMKPVFKQVADTYAGQIAVFAFNSDKSPKAYSKYNQRGVPGLVFFKKNHKKDNQTAGAHTLEQLKPYLEAIIK